MLHQHTHTHTHTHTESLTGFKGFLFSDMHIMMTPNGKAKHMYQAYTDTLRLTHSLPLPPPRPTQSHWQASKASFSQTCTLWWPLVVKVSICTRHIQTHPDTEQFLIKKPHVGIKAHLTVTLIHVFFWI